MSVTHLLLNLARIFTFTFGAGSPRWDILSLAIQKDFLDSFIFTLFLGQAALSGFSALTVQKDFLTM